MTHKEILEKTPTERAKLYHELKDEYFHLRMKKANGQLEKLHRLQVVRRDIARLMTIKTLVDKGDINK